MSRQVSSNEKTKVHGSVCTFKDTIFTRLAEQDGRLRSEAVVARLRIKRDARLIALKLAQPPAPVPTDPTLSAK